MESVMGEKGRRELKVCEKEGGSESVTEKYIFF